jgi:hypothetical protein
LSPDRRSYARHPIATTGSNPLIATVGLLPRAVLVCDISPVGIGLLAAFSPPLGAVLPIWLPSPPGQPSGLVLARVVHVQPPNPDNLHRIGLFCADEVGQSELQQLLDRLTGKEDEDD